MKMKKLTVYFLALFIVFSFSSCHSDWDYTDYTIKSLNKLKSPVVLVGKRKLSGSYSITVKDADGVIETYGNMSVLANTIGESREILDTIK